MTEEVESRVGEVLAGKYRLDDELGRGGMGAVYRAFHLGVHRFFAVKALHEEIAQRKQHAARFLREAQAAGRIGHPGILEVYDVGEDAHGRPFMVMELLHGAPLSRLVADGPMDVATACFVASEVLAILEAAHAADVVHRDVKPQNVFLVDEGEGKTSVKLLDFGIAKFRDGGGPSITGSGEIIGSPLYMAPEQARGDGDVDARADVWSVGAMLYEMITGRAAHVASTAIAVLAKVLTEIPPPPSAQRPEVLPALDAVVTRALTIDREARFPTARAMRDALAEVLAVLPAPKLGPLPRAPLPSDPAAGTGFAATTPAKLEALRTPTSTAPPFDASISNVASSRDVAPTGRTSRVLAAIVFAGLGAASTLWVLRRESPPAGASAAATGASASGASGAADAEPVRLEPAPSRAVLASASVASTGTTMPSASAAPVIAVKAAKVSAKPTAEPAHAPLSAPACAAGEVASSGHCCPRGMVWQVSNGSSGRCERPLATSF